MKKIIIFGSSGSGKSTLAKKVQSKFGLAHLDLDTLAWRPTTPPQRKPLAESEISITQFTDANEEWVIEGCYTDLLEIVSIQANEILFLNPGTENCISNCRKRPWEPHKYNSKKAQDANLEMLIKWIKDYSNRKDEFSLAAHKKFFNNFAGSKMELNTNQEIWNF